MWNENIILKGSLDTLQSFSLAYYHSYHRVFFDIDLAKHSFSFLLTGVYCETH